MALSPILAIVSTYFAESVLNVVGIKLDPKILYKSFRDLLGAYYLLEEKKERLLKVIEEFKKWGSGLYVSEKIDNTVKATIWGGIAAMLIYIGFSTPPLSQMIQREIEKLFYNLFNFSIPIVDDMAVMVVKYVLSNFGWDVVGNIYDHQEEE